MAFKTIFIWNKFTCQIYFHLEIVILETLTTDCVLTGAIVRGSGCAESAININISLC